MRANSHGRRTPIVAFVAAVLLVGTVATAAAQAAAAALSLAIAPGAQAAKLVHVSCGETITKDTKLANDLIDCPGNGLVIGADDMARAKRRSPPSKRLRRAG